MQFTSIDPHKGREVGTYQSLTDAQLDSKLDQSAVAFDSWKNVSLEDRCKLIMRAAEVLKEGVKTYAEMISLEMGKPINEAKGEVLKCAWVCEYYAENAAEFLAPQVIKTDAAKSFVRHDPIGAVFAVMPWNFPFWQVFRFAAPTLIAGNVGLLKHAPNVFGSAELIEDVFTKAGFPPGVFQNLIIHHDATEQIIAHDIVQAITLTGSERAGSAVAAIAGKYLKRSLLELGGNNAFIVWEDADIDEVVKTALVARMLNCGQSCIAAKRFILLEGIYDEFVGKFVAGINQLKAGDPMSEDTQVGPMARRDLADQLHAQVKGSIEMGAELLTGGKQSDCFHEPTVLGNVTADMPAFKEETFGPLAAMIKAKSIDEAFSLSENSRYGLGVTVCTRDTEKALSMANRVSDGAYFVNEMVKSDPRLPFGGAKLSGYGRELSKDGMMEFVNRKTIYVK
ncbi:MAG: succinate-semialdehyde dehydrogenase/glutarate-semialdehyde dehydrogenase [Litorivivens sp.]|jgi:succinate-semialdehyde dehydrogenase/glutarate-semialdehyde dehydrogenase